MYIHRFVLRLANILGCPESVFYNSAPSYKRETKSVKCLGVYLDRTTCIVRNSTK